MGLASRTTTWSFLRAVLAAVVVLLALLGVPAAASADDLAGAPGAASASEPRAESLGPRIVAIRAAHHRGFDRIVFQFNQNRLPPTTITREAGFVIRNGPTGQPYRIPMAGRAVIVVDFYPIVDTDPSASQRRANQAFALPNILALKYGGWWEGEVWYGIGLAKPMPYHVHRLTNPGRLVIDVSTDFAWTTRRVYFQDHARFAAGTEPYVRSVLRPVPAAYPATGLLDRLFAGPTRAERAAGLRFVSSRATGFRSVSVKDQVARLRLTGGCDSAGSTFTIADQVMPTLRRLPTVSWIKIYDPSGHTEQPTGRSDSIPTCLEP
jgi:hypothetical protein